MDKSKKVKVTLTMSQDLVDKLEVISKSMGVTKNSLCTMYVAQCVANYNNTIDVVEKLASQIGSEMLANNVIKNDVK